MPGPSIRSLNTIETKESIDAWYNQTRAFVRAIPTYQRYMDLTWLSHAESQTRGFTDVRNANGAVTTTAATQSTQVEALLDLVHTESPKETCQNSSSTFLYQICDES